MGNVSYFSPLDEPVAEVPYIDNGAPSSVAEQLPVTVIRVPVAERVIAPEVLQDAVQFALRNDDVLTAPWLGTVMLLADPSGDEASHVSLVDWDTMTMLNREYGVQRVYLESTFHLTRLPRFARVKTPDITHVLPPKLISPILHGPFLASMGQGLMPTLSLYPVYRLYSDVFRTFVYGLYPSPYRLTNSQYLIQRNSTPYRALRLLDNDGYNLIPVPSRLYTHGLDNGVNGKRIGVKGGR